MAEQCREREAEFGIPERLEKIVLCLRGTGQAAAAASIEGGNNRCDAMHWGQATQVQQLNGEQTAYYNSALPAAASAVASAMASKHRAASSAPKAAGAQTLAIAVGLAG